MTCTTPYTCVAPIATSLRDFVIREAAELGECNGAQSFRAVRPRDGRPVLLHKFRPAAPLIALGDIVEGRDPPDFSKPFVTRFTDLFTVAGSAYLVEPLPPCSALGDVWRHVLQKRPDQTVTVLAALIRQLVSMMRQLLARGECHGAVDLRNVVLAPRGCFGLLTARVECEEGVLWVRGNPASPPRPDSHGLVETLGSLLELDAEIAALRKTPVRLPMDIHRRICGLLCAIRRADAGPVRPARFSGVPNF